MHALGPGPTPGRREIFCGASGGCTPHTMHPLDLRHACRELSPAPVPRSARSQPEVAAARRAQAISP